MRRILTSALAVLLLTGMIWSCNKKGDEGDGDENPGEADRKALLTNVATNIIVPSFENLATAIEDLKGSAAAFTAAPDETKLAALREEWTQAYRAWQKAELFHFGPADETGLRNYFNIYPTDANLINSNVASGTYNFESVTSNKVQGFPALDYLINGLADDDAGIVAFYTGPDAEGWKKYLTDIVTIMSTKLYSVVNAWKGSYKETFTSNLGTGAGSSFSKMVNEYIMYFERFLRSGKYAIPAGAMSGTPAPEKVEVYYRQELGTTLAQDALQAVADFYRGKAFSSSSTGAGLKSYLVSVNKTDLSNTIDSQFDVIKTKSNSLGPSIYDAIQDDRTAVLELYDEFQEQVRNLKVDMVSAIGISITYTDNDGD